MSDVSGQSRPNSQPFPIYIRFWWDDPASESPKPLMESVHLLGPLRSKVFKLLLATSLLLMLPRHRCMTISQALKFVNLDLILN